MIVLPKTQAKPPHTECSDCEEVLTEKNRVRYLGRILMRCKSCQKKNVQKYNKKRAKALKDSKWF